MTQGKIIAAALAPHPPHLVYGENPPQNEAKSECGWEVLRWGYNKLEKNLKDLDYDVIIVLSPHWRTQTGHHLIGVPHMKSLSVDPIFPNLFRYHYDINFDVDLAQSIHEEIKEAGLPTKMMTNPDFRVDYGTIVSCHMVNPKWDKPIVSISTDGSSAYYNMDVLQAKMFKLGEATRKAVEKSGKRAIILASHSLSHRHFKVESELPEDMAAEHIENHNQYVWDMKMIELMKKGKSKEIIDILPDFTEQTIAETDSGGLTWLLSALELPTYPAEVLAYGTVIGTGNAIVQWDNINKGANL